MQFLTDPHAGALPDMTDATGRRLAYLDMIEAVGQRWLALFEGDTDLYSAAYWDLLTALWRHGRPMRKTDALAAMRGIRSAHTAGKYVDAAIRRGLILERDNPQDARSKVLMLSDDMRRRLDRFFDQALDDVRATAARIDGQG
jgi:DNA-binding MarR family transcriptional regulator